MFSVTNHTRLSKLHPYPAMVADELALDIAHRHVTPGVRVLDPFCGSGRLLVACVDASLRVGTDVNPLACLISRAKLSAARSDVISDAIESIGRRGDVYSCYSFPELERRVEWFSSESLKQLSEIIFWINALRLDEPELLVFAACLSATAREVSYARQEGWKLHRLDADGRSRLRTSAWTRFRRRLTYCCAELREAAPVLGRHRVHRMDACVTGSPGGILSRYGEFDIVLTSPPYGDSRTTVQYGGASSLCLTIVSALTGLEDLARSGGNIDAQCLGGTRRNGISAIDIERYWDGTRDSYLGKNVLRFLADYDHACRSIAACVRSGGKAIFVVGRRITDGHVLYLDRFTEDRFSEYGFSIVDRSERLLQKKRLPEHINRFGRSRDDGKRKSGVMRTMATEVILVLQKVRC